MLTIARMIFSTREAPTISINGGFGEPEKKISINFS